MSWFFMGGRDGEYGESPMNPDAREGLQIPEETVTTPWVLHCPRTFSSGNEKVLVT